MMFSGPLTSTVCFGLIRVRPTEKARSPGPGLFRSLRQQAFAVSGGNLLGAEPTAVVTRSHLPHRPRVSLRSNESRTTHGVRYAESDKDKLETVLAQPQRSPLSFGGGGTTYLYETGCSADSSIFHGRCTTRTPPDAVAGFTERSSRIE